MPGKLRRMGRAKAKPIGSLTAMMGFAKGSTHPTISAVPLGRPIGVFYLMSKQSSQSLADQLKPFVTPFRVDGSSEFHLKSHKTNEKGGLDKEKGEKIIEA